MNGAQAAAEVEATMQRATRALHDSTISAMRDAANVAKDRLESSGRNRVPSLHFRNMRGASIGVQATATDTTVTVTPQGPWGILEPGARPHSINSTRAMPIGRGQWRRGPFRHPGTPNTEAWTSGQDATLEQVGTEIPQKIGDAVEGAFSG
jgi:hypothetical protein